MDVPAKLVEKSPLVTPSNHACFHSTKLKLHGYTCQKNTHKYNYNSFLHIHTHHPKFIRGMTSSHSNNAFIKKIIPSQFFLLLCRKDTLPLFSLPCGGIMLEGNPILYHALALFDETLQAFTYYSRGSSIWFIFCLPGNLYSV
jgi:hypothetical protein